MRISLSSARERPGHTARSRRTVMTAKPQTMARRLVPRDLLKGDGLANGLGANARSRLKTKCISMVSHFHDKELLPLVASSGDDRPQTLKLSLSRSTSGIFQACSSFLGSGLSGHLI